MRAKRIDANQNEIVKAIRDMGVSVAITSSLGNGFPDLVLGVGGTNWLVEIKDGGKPLSAQKLTVDEQEFHNTWRGQVDIIRCVEDAVSLVARIRHKIGLSL